MSGLRIILAADESAGQRALRLIERSEHELVLVATSPTDAGTAMRSIASDMAVPLMDARELSRPDSARVVEAAAPDVLLNVHSLPKVCTEVLDVFEVGAWNLHPGPLPEAAGINAPSWAVALGWREYGVSLHQMTPEYDAGHLTYEDRFSIRDNATGLSLSAECASRGLRLVAALLDQLAEDPGSVPHTPQELTRRQYFGRGQPNEGMIDWAAPASEIDAHVRAADFRPFTSPWTVPRARIDGELFDLIEVAIGDESDASPGHLRNENGMISVSARDRWIDVIKARKVMV